MMKLIDTIDVDNELGEGIIWDHGRQRIWWTDIQQNTLYRYEPRTGALEHWRTPERLCCFAPIDNDAKLVCAFESGFAFYAPETGETEWIERLEQDNPGTRFNDGRTDRQGRLWAGTMVENQETAMYQGSLYCLNGDLTVTKTLEGLSITNSLCWSPDGKILYHTDTPTQRIRKYPFNGNTAELGTGSKFVQTATGCYPDGSIVDSEGFLWNAQWGGSKVARYSPEGVLDYELEVPTSQPTCVAFGGADLDLLFVTTAWSDMSKKETGAGSVYVYQGQVTGLLESSFKLMK